MSDRTAAPARFVFAFVVLCFVGGVVLTVLSRAAGGPVAWTTVSDDVLFWLSMLSFAVVGLLIASRHPDNPIGWILLAIGLVWELTGALAEGYVSHGLVEAPGSLPAADVVAALTAGMWAPGIGLIGTFLLLLFPDGRLPSRRWRPLAWASGTVLALVTLLIPLIPESLPVVTEKPELPDVANPLGVEALGPVLERLLMPLVALIPLCIIGCAASVVVRFRRSRGLERLQLKWLAASAGLAAAIYLVAMVATMSFGSWSPGVNPLWLDALQRVSLYSFMLIPAAVGIAILRYRLFDIDVIIKRALLYGVLTGALGSVYAGSVLGVGSVMRAITDQRTNNLVIAVSTLAVAALFGPLRSRLQSFIDRRFYRRRYDAVRTVESFSARMRDEVDVDSISGELRRTVHDVMHPAHVSLWLTPPDTS
ncbi:MAG TPA: hypothetical protein VM840_11765 [Actinomycetota bacterium]|nr:hypothetical protein [Actinomycetota bacterium]